MMYLDIKIHCGSGIDSLSPDAGLGGHPHRPRATSADTPEEQL